MANETATYTKLKNGAWGVRVPGLAQVGQVVSVVKRSGEAKTEVVKAVLWHGTARDGREASLVSIAGTRAEPTTLSGETATVGQHWSSRGSGPTERLCAGGCGRRVGPRYAECYSCHQESIEAM